MRSSKGFAKNGMAVPARIRGCLSLVRLRRTASGLGCREAKRWARLNRSFLLREMREHRRIERCKSAVNFAFLFFLDCRTRSSALDRSWFRL